MWYSDVTLTINDNCSNKQIKLCRMEYNIQYSIIVFFKLSKILITKYPIKKILKKLVTYY